MIPTIKDAMEQYKAGTYTLQQALAVIRAHMELTVNELQAHGTPDYQVGFVHCKTGAVTNIKHTLDEAGR